MSRYARAIAVCALFAACSRGSTRPGPQPTGLLPPAGYTAQDLPVTIAGQSFEPTARQQVGGGGGVEVDSTFRAFLGPTELKDVQWESLERLTAVVPAGLTGGPFDLRVIGPTGEGVASAAFRGSSASPPDLTASLSMPALVEVGTSTGVDLYLVNGGGVPVSGPGLQLLADPGLSIVGVPGAPGEIQPGETVHSVAQIAGQARGLQQLELRATGQDGFTGGPLATSAWGSIQVVSPPALGAQPASTPATVSVGQSFDVTVDVVNTGDVDAAGLAFGALQVAGQGAIATGPAPAAQDVPAGGTRTFRFHVQAASPGLVTLTASGTATDPMSGQPVSLQVVWEPILVQLPANLTASWLQLPGSVAPGQSFTASLAVGNAGQASAQGVAATPDPPSVQPPGAATVTAGAAAADIGGGGTQVFTWTFTANGPLGSSIKLSAGAGGSDGNSGTAVTAASVTSPPVAVQNLSASFSVAPFVLRTDGFNLVLHVGNAGSAAVNAVTPSALSITGGVSCGAVSPASANLAALSGSADFTWACTATAGGPVQFSVSVTGNENGTGAPRSASASTNLTVVDSLALSSDPLGDGTAVAQVYAFGGQVYVGPNARGTGAARFQPDGSGRQALSFSFAADGNDLNTAQGPYPSLGFTGCAANTLQCGPDNEDGRGFFGTATVAGAPWLVAGGSRSAARLSHVYASTDAGPAIGYSYIYLKGVIGPSQRNATWMTGFGDLLLLGLGGKGLMLVALKAMPSPPGETPVWGTMAFDITPYGVPAMSATTQIDATLAVGGRLHVFNAGGCARIDQPDVTASNLTWTSCTPSAPAYAAKASLATAKTGDLTPADYAFPGVVPFGGRIYAARNTVAGPQLWACAPGADGLCDPGDWSLVAPNGSGDAELTQFDDPASVSITLLAATSTHLYVGFDNAGGVAVFRSLVTAPSSRADFQRVGPGGLGLSATRIFDAKAIAFSGSQFVYATVGDGSSPVQLVRLVD
jgi:hypothetical protein